MPIANQQYNLVGIIFCRYCWFMQIIVMKFSRVSQLVGRTVLAVDVAMVAHCRSSSPCSYNADYCPRFPRGRVFNHTACTYNISCEDNHGRLRLLHYSSLGIASIAINHSHHNLGRQLCIKSWSVLTVCWDVAPVNVVRAGLKCCNMHASQ